MPWRLERGGPKVLLMPHLKIYGSVESGGPDRDPTGDLLVANDLN